MYYVDIENGPLSRDWHSYADALRDLSAQIEGEHDSLIEQAEDEIEANEYTNEYHSVSAQIDGELAIVTIWNAERIAPIDDCFTVEFLGRYYHVRPTE